MQMFIPFLYVGYYFGDTYILLATKYLHNSTKIFIHNHSIA